MQQLRKEDRIRLYFMRIKSLKFSECENKRSAPQEILEDERSNLLFRVYKMTGQARDEGVPVKRSSTSKYFKRKTNDERRHCVCKVSVKEV